MAMAEASTQSSLSLPTEVPVFPLPAVLLLPRARLPLNIFEQRYRNMVEDVLAGGRFMGMVQTIDAHEGLVPDDAPVFGIGTLGRLSSFAETDDGRFLITLSGICRFQTVREIEGRNGYRRWRVDYGPFLDDVGRDDSQLVDRVGLMAVVKSYFESRGLHADWSALEQASDEAVATSLAMACPFEESRDKQALLESANTAERGRTLQVLLEMALHSAAGSGATTN
jgi:Lon protease-like protein